MNSGFQLFDIILFAMIAAFLVLRLRSVLGRRTGNERPPPTGIFGRKDAPDSDDGKVVPLPPRADRPPVDVPAPQETLPISPEAGIAQIRAADRGFDPDIFVEGAKSAFEMIVGAFAQGDIHTLRPLLNDSVYTQFSDAIRERETQKQTLETTIVAMKAVDLHEAHMEGPMAFVTVRFVSDQINVVRNAAGAVVDGEPGQTVELIDLWTFARDTRSGDPNWLLVTTATPQ
ncbi:putative lipid-binding transport protein (Tim44 family) [Stella humosa]|uniref:Putative lipid-binding transport protein (Tim44 family) n=1 Tax=Stella humosa TaxID=94 RepID=A0A3N1LJC7_9PROT|nr:Tim44/TimA family putative adaptor protein [Stella humosa]ROP90968.1 putative lipid-binding transport protein (Tim44 family) [Stella humosa]BBK34682.1 hypothetical protein STHU_53160 [Stella humosa]